MNGAAPAGAARSAAKAMHLGVMAISPALKLGSPNPARQQRTCGRLQSISVSKRPRLVACSKGSVPADGAPRAFLYVPRRDPSSKTLGPREKKPKWKKGCRRTPAAAVLSGARRRRPFSLAAATRASAAPRPGDVEQYNRLVIVLARQFRSDREPMIRNRGRAEQSIEEADPPSAAVIERDVRLVLSVEPV